MRIFAQNKRSFNFGTSSKIKVTMSGFCNLMNDDDPPAERLITETDIVR